MYTPLLDPQQELERRSNIHTIKHFNKTGEIRAFTPEGEMIPLKQKNKTTTK